ncbi:hypothetical protein [Rufibacter glacialis]|uniref:hypothetical protein n=1 Tax=Rufibacter glacialis TaxID=1259555 RepID=UPI0016686375|nr:hypothetical protein [Rufibacter glacialis]
MEQERLSKKGLHPRQLHLERPLLLVTVLLGGKCDGVAELLGGTLMDRGNGIAA